MDYDSDNSTHNNDDHLSKIRVIFNSKFKQFIANLRRNNDLSNLYLTNMDLILPTQLKLREYIQQNQDQFDMEHGSININKFESHPDFFAIMICVIIPNLDLYSNFQEILNESNKHQWHFSLYSSDNQEDGLEEYAANYFRCACHHSCSPENLFIITNIHSNQNILIGCDCAKKTGFIEPQKIKNTLDKRDNDPKYMRFIEDAKRKNEIKHMTIMREELAKTHLDIDTVKQTYQYYGGTHDEHLEYFNIVNKDSDNTIEDLVVEECDTCCQKVTKKILLLNTDEGQSLCVCVKCCNILEKYPKKLQGIKGFCEDCGEKHRNRSDNYCSFCRNKTNCITCRKRDFCTNEHCQDCCTKYIYCSKCNREKVKQRGHRCQKCFSKTKKCKCGAIIFNEKYKTCYDCKNTRYASSIWT